MKSITFTNVPETWGELKKWCVEHYSEEYPHIKVTEEEITDGEFVIRNDGTILFYGEMLTEYSEIESIFLFLIITYGD